MKSNKTENKDVSSANIFASDSKLSGRSLMKIKNKSGPRIEPWGTPARIFFQSEDWPFKTTFWNLSERKSSRGHKSDPFIP